MWLDDIHYMGLLLHPAIQCYVISGFVSVASDSCRQVTERRRTEVTGLMIVMEVVFRNVTDSVY
jgi:hypothetical protein